MHKDHPDRSLSEMRQQLHQDRAAVAHIPDPELGDLQALARQTCSEDEARRLRRLMALRPHLALWYLQVRRDLGLPDLRIEEEELSPAPVARLATSDSSPRLLLFPLDDLAQELAQPMRLAASSDASRVVDRGHQGATRFLLHTDGVKLMVTVERNGRPLANAQVTLEEYSASTDGGFQVTATTSASGYVELGPLTDIPPPRADGGYALALELPPEP